MKNKEFWKTVIHIIVTKTQRGKSLLSLYF